MDINEDGHVQFTEFIEWIFDTGWKETSDPVQDLVLKGRCLSRLFSFALSFFPSFFLVSLSLSLCLNEMSGYRTDNTASDCQCFPRNMLTNKDCFVARHSA